MRKEIKSGEIQLGNITLRCSVLDNGQRVINSEDFAKLFEKEAEYSQEEAVRAFEDLLNL